MLNRESRTLEVDCTVEVCHRFENLGAHVDLDGNPPIHAGDKILVHGAPIHAAYGEVVIERRRATVTRAGWLVRLWTRLRAHFEVTELLDVSFTDRRTQ